MIKKYEHISKELTEMRENGTPKGDLTGFKSLDGIYTMKQGSYTFILAAPHHGKSEFCFELVFNQAAKYGKKTLIYSPETGSVEDIYAEFVHKYTGKPFYKTMPGSVSDKEYHAALNYIDEYFSIVDSDEKSYSFQELADLRTTEQIMLTDPYNELRHEMELYGSRQDLYIEDLCGEVRRYCKKNKVHWLLTLHPASQQIQIAKNQDGKDTGYYPMPMARQAAGGQALLRKAMCWINLWRPPSWMNNEHGMPYKENEVLIQIEKAKPKGVAVKGMISMNFDWKMNRYYETIAGAESYAFQHEKINQVTDFTMPISEQFNNETAEASF